MNFDKVLFRCSSLGHLMSPSKEKSNLDLYNDAVALTTKLNDDLATMSKFNKDGKTFSANYIKKENALMLQ